MHDYFNKNCNKRMIVSVIQMFYEILKDINTRLVVWMVMY
jgi:hypothetical protein